MWGQLVRRKKKQGQFTRGVDCRDAVFWGLCQEKSSAAPLVMAGLAVFVGILGIGGARRGKEFWSQQAAEYSSHLTVVLQFGAARLKEIPVNDAVVVGDRGRP
jgi:hypothetical protein